MTLDAASNRRDSSANNLPPDTSAATAAPFGLTTAEAGRRLAEFGRNAIPDEVPNRWRAFLTKFWAPVPWMLEAAMVLQIALGEYVEAVMVGGLLLFNATLGFIQEGRAGSAVAALKQRLAPTASVHRDGEWVRLKASELVPWDLIRLSLGASVPADANILSGSVMIDQSMLTGESVPVDANRGAQIYAGSIVRRGQALAEVTATGAQTYFGRAAELVRIAHSTSTEQKAVFSATRNLALINGTVAALIVIYAYVAALPVADLVRLALTALLATIPVALPATFTLSASFGAQILARKGVHLTRLTAAHEAAAMNVLCVDKTGTLTRNTLEIVEVSAMQGFDRMRVLALATMASSESDQDPIDTAIRAAAAKEALPAPDERPVRFVPFDPSSKISEALIVDRDGNQQRIIKGAFEAVTKMAESPPAVSGLVNDLAERGHRIIAVAIGVPDSLRLAGLIALSDPPREDSAGLIGTLHDMNVRTIGEDAAGARVPHSNSQWQLTR